ncbi:hypothetical protein ACWZHB_06990 [Nocardia sp. FBN12]|uniref:hypothetical protein n=1 Tax=Nocardia sp. FBN12 TaxID=3419766 RepID=UPI003D046EB0
MATNSTKSGSEGSSEKVENTQAHLTSFLSSVVDSTKGLVDDLLDTAGRVEKDARNRVETAREKVTPGDEDIESLRKHVRSLTEQVEELARIRK